MLHRVLPVAVMNLVRTQRTATIANSVACIAVSSRLHHTNRMKECIEIRTAHHSLRTPQRG